MTLGAPNSQSESLMLAFNKRKAQLDRWRESDTEKESHEIRNRPKRVKFADKCIFQAACAANDKLQVAKMIKDGYDINAVDEDGITALHQACIEDNLDMVEFLLKHGADVNISDNEGWTPLHAVATCCYVSIAKLLLEHGANVVALNNDCSIPLDICKSDEIREIFIQDINAKGIDLKDARRGEELRMIQDAKQWLQNGHSEDPHPITGATALHVASCKGYIKVLDQIIKSGANINVKDFDGWTPLHAAAHWGQKEACEILLENNCDVTIKDNCDQTPLDVADRSVLPVFEQFKRKRDINKNVEKTTNSLPTANTHIGPVIQIQSKKLVEKPTKEEDVKIIPTTVSSVINKESNEANTTAPESKRKSQIEVVPSFATPSTLPSSSTSASSTSATNFTPLPVAITLGKVTEESCADENSPSWRRTSSLRSKNTTSPVVEDISKSQEKIPVRRTKGELNLLAGNNDTSLRRAYSFESDPKFYTRLRDARNRVKANNSSSSPTNTAILENIPTVTPTPDNLIHNAQLLSSNAITSTSISPVNDNSLRPLTSSKLQEGFVETVLTRFIPKRVDIRNKELETASQTSTSGSQSLSNRGSQQDAKVRSNDGNNAKVSGPVSKFKQFLFKSFVPPTRDEESETQRKANAKRVRETRRSTQGVTLEELKSAEQYARNSLQGSTTAAEQPNAATSTTVPAIIPVPKKEEEANIERRPSWRLRVDEQDPSKFSLEDTRNLPTIPKNSGVGDNYNSTVVQRSSSLRSRTSANKNERSVHGKPPKPPEGTEISAKVSAEEKDMKNSGAQGAILRKKKTKRRSTGIVQYNQDGTEITQTISGSDVEVGSGSGLSSDIDQAQDSSRSENGVAATTINYKKLYEEAMKENQLLKGRLLKTEEDVADLKLKLERVTITPRITSEDVDKREKRALERKLSEMEEELKQIQKLKLDNEKLKAENRALTRVVSKLSGNGSAVTVSGGAGTPTGNGPRIPDIYVRKTRSFETKTEH